jgi:Kef-type K+ transport system membrane component KefB
MKYHFGWFGELLATTTDVAPIACAGAVVTHIVSWLILLAAPLTDGHHSMTAKSLLIASIVLTAAFAVYALVMGSRTQRTWDMLQALPVDDQKLIINGVLEQRAAESAKITGFEREL